MSTPKSKKPAVKPVEQKARFAIGQKVFIIDRSRSNPGYIFQAKVECVRAIKGLRGSMSEGVQSNGKMFPHTTFEYDLSTMSGWFTNQSEYYIHPTLNAASLEFTNQFTHLLK